MSRAPIRIVREPPERRVLVTGGAGFVGRLLCRALADNPDVRVICFDRQANIDPPLGRANYRFVGGDIADRARIAMLLVEERIDSVVNLASACAPAGAVDRHDMLIASNVSGVQRLTDATLDYWHRLPGDYRARFRFIHASTCEVFGDLAFDAPPITEAAPYRPLSPYAATRAASDLIVRASGSSYGLPVVISSAANLYGPGQRHDSLILRTIHHAVDGLPIELYGTGGQTRDWLHVEDYVQALIAMIALGESGAQYLVGAREEHSNVAVVAAICDMLDRIDPRADGLRRRTLIRFVADRPGHIRRQAIDPARAERALGWRAQIAFEAGLSDMIDRYRRRDAHLGLANGNRG